MPKYTFTRLSVYNEQYRVDARSEAEARARIEQGDYESDIVEWIDWAEDDYELVQEEEELETWLRQGAARCDTSS